MNTIKKALLLSVITVLISGMSFAQSSLKIGYIDSNEILTMMPETDSLQQELKKYADNLQQQLGTMMQEYQTKVQDYQANMASMSDLIRQTKEKEIQDLQTRIQQFQASADQDLQTKQNELFNPIIKKVKDAITEVGAENHYNYILDIAQGVVLYYENGDNILPLVKKKLGIK
jgi:outer membrane protein